MSLMHVAFQAVSKRVERLAAEAQEGGDLGPFREAFDFWVKQLLYHATAEDKYMTAPLTDAQPARDNEAEHAELVQHGGGLIEFLGKGDAAGISDSMTAAVLALEESEHKELVGKLQEVEDALKQEIGQDRVLARTRRHLYQRVMAMRVLEFDHFENEEAFVVSLVGERISEQQQLEMARHLLFDDEAEDPRWIIDWVAAELTPAGRSLLSELESRLPEAHGREAPGEDGASRSWLARLGAALFGKGR
jgi:hemerythrin superfamily protein